MVDSTCVMQSFIPSYNQQVESVLALGESVSFGKYMNQNLDWDKFSAFNQNRYLEEAQRLAKPGLVAQRKALFEAHFNKPVVDKAGSMNTKNGVRVLRNEFNKENFNGEPCKDMGSAKSIGLCTKAAKSRTDALWGVNLTQAVATIESQSREVVEFVKNSAIQMDDHRFDMTTAASENLEVDHIVTDPKPLEKIESINGLKTVLNQRESVCISTTPVARRLDKTPVQESFNKFVFASTDSEAAFSSSNSLKNHAVPSPSKVRSQDLLMKENNAPENSKASGISMVLSRKVKTLDVPFDQNPSLLVTKMPPTVKELENLKCPVSARGSKVHCNLSPSPTQLHLRRQANITIPSEASSSKTKSSAEPELRPAPTQLKQKMNISRANMTSMRKSVVQKETSKWNVPSYAQRTAVKSVSTSTAMSTSSRAPANKVPSDAANIGKHTVPSSTSFGRKSSIQSQAKPQSKYGSKVIQMNPTRRLSRNNLKTSLPKAIHMSVRPSFNYGSVKRSTTTLNSGSSRITSLDARVSKESSNHKREFLQKSVQTSAARRNDDKGSIRQSTRLHEPSSGIKITKRPPTTATVFTPFRFRSEERAAICKQKLELNSSAEVENRPQLKRKVAGPSNNKPHASIASSKKR